MYQLPATYTSQGRCQRTPEESCRMGTEHPHFHPRSLRSGRTVYSRGARDREQDIGHPARTVPPYFHHEPLRKQTLQRDSGNTRYDYQRRGIPHHPSLKKVTYQPERLHSIICILILHELIRSFRPHSTTNLLSECKK